MVKGTDYEKQVATFDQRANYHVYDIIEEKRRYNIFRLENENVNPFIRFKIIGCKHEGLCIRFSKFDDD